ADAMMPTHHAAERRDQARAALLAARVQPRYASGVGARADELERCSAPVGEPLDQRRALLRQRPEQLGRPWCGATGDQIPGEALGVVAHPGRLLPAGARAGPPP